MSSKKFQAFAANMSPEEFAHALILRKKILKYLMEER